MGDFEEQTDGDILTKQEIETKEPPMFKVILLNDDYTTMEFVILVLQSVFRKQAEEAQSVMISVHEKGAGVAGVYTKEIAETKVATVHHLATQNEYPLKCSMEAA